MARVLNVFIYLFIFLKILSLFPNCSWYMADVTLKTWVASRGLCRHKDALFTFNMLNCFKDYKRYTVGTPYNTNVGVQKIPDRAIWKPVVAKRNNTNPWSCSKPQILVTRDSRQVHMAEQPASRHRLGSKFLPSCIHHRLPDNSLISVNL